LVLKIHNRYIYETLSDLGTKEVWARASKLKLFRSKFIYWI